MTFGWLRRRQSLQRIEDGKFGRCLACEGPVGRQRLRALPVAALCIACTEEQERAA